MQMGLFLKAAHLLLVDQQRPENLYLSWLVGRRAFSSTVAEVYSFLIAVLQINGLLHELSTSQFYRSKTQHSKPGFATKDVKAKTKVLASTGFHPEAVGKDSLPGPLKYSEFNSM